MLLALIKVDGSNAGKILENFAVGPSKVLEEIQEELSKMDETAIAEGLAQTTAFWSAWAACSPSGDCLPEERNN